MLLLKASMSNEPKIENKVKLQQLKLSLGAHNVSWKLVVNYISLLMLILYKIQGIFKSLFPQQLNEGFNIINWNVYKLTFKWINRIDPQI